MNPWEEAEYWEAQARKIRNDNTITEHTARRYFEYAQKIRTLGWGRVTDER